MSARRLETLRRELVEAIRERGIDHLEVLHAFDHVPRHLFVPQSVQHRAYEDAALPIGYGQTISQPGVQALYLERLELQPTDRVLEIGTGSGYQTALLAQLVAHVYSIERISELSERARRALDQLPVRNVTLFVGDGSLGRPETAPYHAILVAAAAPRVPQPLAEQLAAGGRMLVPVGDLQQQRLLLVRRTGTGWAEEEIAGCVFVPLLGQFGWPANGPEAEA